MQETASYTCTGKRERQSRVNAGAFAMLSTDIAVTMSSAAVIAIHRNSSVTVQ